MQIAQQPCYYCGDLPIEKDYDNFKIVDSRVVKLHGIDRVNNLKGYIKGNCVSCCKKCNVAKSTMSKEDFLNHINKIYDHLS